MAVKQVGLSNFAEPCPAAPVGSQPVGEYVVSVNLIRVGREGGVAIWIRVRPPIEYCDPAQQFGYGMPCGVNVCPLCDGNGCAALQCNHSRPTEITAVATFEIPDGSVLQAYRFALDPTPAQARALSSHAGAARYAHNHMLALVKAVMDQRAAERSYSVDESQLTPTFGWSLAALRKVWNQRKPLCAPWWPENSKEAYNTGLDGLARGLEAWSASRRGLRVGKVVGFPRFKSARARRSVRFTTGAIRCESDRHHVTLPRVGTIRTLESTRKLARRVEAETARILSATVTQDATGRWYCAFQTVVAAKARPAHAAYSPHQIVGVDVGVKVDSLLVVATPDGVEVARVPAAKSLTA